MTDHSENFEGILGNSPQIQSVFGAIRKMAASDASVSLQEKRHRKGTRRPSDSSTKCAKGRTVHSHQLRRHPENLLESELFGHEKGSFTGAHTQRQGRIETAEGGTLFLDEIGELTGPLQVKLLRFLQQHEVERVGGRTLIKVDTRVIAATNVDLVKAMADGRFREDLYYRLAVLVSLPPLRQRDGDTLLLANTSCSGRRRSCRKVWYSRRTPSR
jgi:transcriptional regulator with GAF, ATPase, and Fis domain